MLLQVGKENSENDYWDMQLYGKEKRGHAEFCQKWLEIFHFWSSPLKIHPFQRFWMLVDYCNLMLWSMCFCLRFAAIFYIALHPESSTFGPQISRLCDAPEHYEPDERFRHFERHSNSFIMVQFRNHVCLILVPHIHSIVWMLYTDIRFCKYLENWSRIERNLSDVYPGFYIHFKDPQPNRNRFNSQINFQQWSKRLDNSHIQSPFCNI